MSNVILNDKCLSAKAKGVYCYLFSKPDNWDFSSERIANEFSDGEKSIRSALKELEDAGYLERQKLWSGRMDYFLRINSEKEEETQTAETGGRVKEPNGGKGNQPKRQPAEIGGIYNTDIDNNIENIDISLSINNIWSSKKIFEAESFEYKICEFFYKTQEANGSPVVLYNLKKYWIEKNIQSGADVVEKLQRLDKFPPEIIKMVFLFALQDSFWKNNILSVEKFRKKSEKMGCPYFVALLSKLKEKHTQDQENIVHKF